MIRIFAAAIAALALLTGCSGSDTPPAQSSASAVDPSIPETTTTFSDPLVDSFALVVERYADCLAPLSVDPASGEATPQTDGSILVTFAGPPALAFSVPLQRGNGGQVFTAPADDATIAALAQVGC